MTLGEAIYDVREALKEYSDDSELSNEYIIYLLNIKRAKYIKQNLDKLNRRFNTRLTQTLCLDTEEISSNECGIDLGCDTVIRSVVKIPDLVQLTNKNAVQRIGPADKLTKSFNLINRDRAPFYLDSNFNKKIKAFIHDDGHVYLISSEPILLNCISITAIFEDPSQLQNFKNCCGCNDDPTEVACFDLDNSQYPIQSDLFDFIRLDVINELIKRGKYSTEDKINDSQDD